MTFYELDKSNNGDFSKKGDYVIMNTEEKLGLYLDEIETLGYIVQAVSTSGLSEDVRERVGSFIGNEISKITEFISKVLLEKRVL